ncbi:MAG TPA: hypothetical protein VG983_07835 [Caulobacterales bacterium]|nr:hypothetical protein [Caulobacterales bacterium]
MAGAHQQNTSRQRLGAAAWALPAALALAIMATFAACAWLAQTTPAIADYAKAETERVKAINGVYLYDAGYVDDADFLLLGQIPHDDYARGGVYFIGDSKMTVSLMPWLMSAEERRYIHNYSIGALRHDEERDLFRMLIDECGLLRAGGARTTVFLDVSYYLARPKTAAVRLDYYIHRHGLYTYKPGEGMHRAPITPLQRFLSVQRDYAQRYLAIVFGLRQSRVTGEAPWAKNREGRVLRADWPEEMRRQVNDLAALLDDLQSRGVHVVAIYPPSGSWDDTMPYQPAYHALVDPLLKARGVPVIDQRDQFPDADFADAAHLSYSAAVKVHEANLRAARRALSDMGISLAASPGP